MPLHEFNFATYQRGDDDRGDNQTDMKENVFFDVTDLQLRLKYFFVSVTSIRKTVPIRRKETL